MTQQPSSTHQPSKLRTQRYLLRSSAAWLGSLSLLSSGLVMAQTNAQESVVVPSVTVTPDVPPPAPKPAVVPIAPAAPPAPSVSIPVNPEPKPIARPVSPPPATPKPTASVAAPAAPTASAPEPAKQPVKLSAPSVSIPAARIETTPQPQPQPRITTASQTGKNSYIDTTNYNAGSNEPPAAVVITERSSGCQTVVSNGQLNSGSCSSIAVKPPKPSTTAQSPQPASTSQVSYTRKQPQPITTAVRPRNTRPNSNKAQKTASGSKRYSRPSSSGEKATGKTYRPIQPKVIPPTGNTSLLFPLSIPATITSVFGWRMHPISGTQRFHSGTDIGAPMGTPVLAAYPGEVAVADSLGGYGLTVIIRHLEGSQESRYAHLSQMFVQSGDWVEQGQLIGLVGSTGNSTGPHLHFEWRHLTSTGWVAVDAGLHLEMAMENLMQGLQTAQAQSRSGS